MKTLRAAFAISTICLLVACSDDGTGGTGKGGTSGGATAGTGGSGSGGSGTGTAGATGTGGGGGGQGSCQACVACLNTSCATQIATCRADTGCNMIYECGSACVMTVQQCVGGNIAAALMWAQTVQGCYTANCSAQCMY